MEFWLEVVAKAVTYAAALLVVGTAGHRWVLLPQATDGFSSRQRQALAADADRILRWSAGMLVVGLTLRVFAHTAAAFGFEDAWRWENVRLIAVESRWGASWQRQFAVAVLLLLAAITTSAFPHARPAAGIASIAFCFVTPLLGHASGETSAVAVHGFHVLAAGGWVGTLGCVMLAGSDVSRALRPALLRAFAPLAMAGVGLLLATGAVAAWTYVGVPSNLWTTEYGRLLSLKLMGVALVLGLGGANWWRLHRRARLPREGVAWTEVLLSGAVVALTAWLTETGHP